MDKDLLAIGSIINTTQSEKLLMIIGYGYKNDETKDIYDYITVTFPIGLINKEVVLVNKMDIKDILFIGYQTPQSIKEREKINQILEDIKKSSNKENE